MLKLWSMLVPELKRLCVIEQVSTIENAKKERFTTTETLILIIWMLLVFSLVQQVLKQSTHENKIAFAIVTNLIVTLPLMLAVFIPIYIKKMKRSIVKILADSEKR